MKTSDIENTKNNEFMVLIAEHQDVLRAFVRCLVPSHSDADDILQETNLVLWDKRADFERNSNFGAWAFRIARFKALAHFRDQQRSKEMNFDPDLIDQLSATVKSELEGFGERREALRHCLQGMSADNRELLRMRYSDPRPMREFAAAAGKTIVAMRKSLERIRGHLKKCIVRRTEATT